MASIVTSVRSATPKYSESQTGKVLIPPERLDIPVSQSILKIKNRKTIRVILAVAAVFLTLAIGGTASASTVAAKPSFTVQALSYGLSGAQVRTLEQEVNAYTAAHGGKQTAINEVTSTGDTVIFAVPGQKFAYPVTSAVTASPAHEGELCPSKAFCTFQKANFEGSESEYYECNTKFPNSYSGSWKNDQTAGIQALLYVFESTGHIGEQQTCAAYCNDSSWPANSPIVDVDPC